MKTALTMVNWKTEELNLVFLLENLWASIHYFSFQLYTVHIAQFLCWSSCVQKTLLQHRIGAETSMTTATAMTAMTAAVSRIDDVTVGMEEEPAQLDNRYGEGIADVKKTKKSLLKISQVWMWRCYMERNCPCNNTNNLCKISKY